MKFNKISLSPAFLALGYQSVQGKVRYFFFSHLLNIEIEFSQAEMMNRQAFDQFFASADRQFWLDMGLNLEYKFLDKTSKDKMFRLIDGFLQHAINECTKKGIKKAFKFIRQGAHEIKGKIYFHLGEVLLDERLHPVPFGEYGANYVFVKSNAINYIEHELVSEAEALDMQRFFSNRSWRNPMAPTIIMGHIYLSLLSGIAEWRPHISINGEADVGKSAISKAIKNLLVENASCSLQAGEKTTEAGIRYANDCYARLIMLEEAEGMLSDSKDHIMALARLASDGQVNRQATQIRGVFVEYYIPCCFMMFSIGLVAKEHADATRFLILDLLKDPNHPLDYKVIDKLRDKYFNEHFGRRLHFDAYSNARRFKELTTQIINMLTDEDRSVRNIAPILAAYCCLMKRTDDMEYITELINKIKPTLAGIKNLNKYSEKERFIMLFLLQPIELELSGHRYRKPLVKWLRMVVEKDNDFEDEALRRWTEGRDGLQKLIQIKLADFSLGLIEKGGEMAFLHIGSTSPLLYQPYKNTTLINKVKTILLSLNAENKFLHISGKLKAFGWKIPYERLFETPSITDEDVKEYE
jgi:hypothetical protein